jgi:hypothetical protein
VEYKVLHSLFFRKPGSKTSQKKTILEFHGFSWTTDEEQLKILDYVQQKAGGWTLPLLKDVMDLLCVNRSGLTTKEALLDAFAKWVLAPSESTKVRKVGWPSSPLISFDMDPIHHYLMHSFLRLSIY